MASVDIFGDKQLNVYLDTLSMAMRPQIVEALDTLGPYMETKIKDKLGTYQTGWPRLKRATVEAKYRRRAHASGVSRGGFKRLVGLINSGMGDDPLVLHGDLKNSIKHEVHATDLELILYSDVKYAAVQEYGHKNIPARSYMRLTLWKEEDHIVKTISDKVGEKI